MLSNRDKTDLGKEITSPRVRTVVDDGALVGLVIRFVRDTIVSRPEHTGQILEQPYSDWRSANLRRLQGTRFRGCPGPTRDCAPDQAAHPFGNTPGNHLQAPGPHQTLEESLPVSFASTGERQSLQIRKGPWVAKNLDSANGIRFDAHE